MGKLTDFYKQHRRLFLAQKHQNIRQTERFKDMAAVKFLSYCESKNVFHTDGLRRKELVTDFFNGGEMVNKSPESRRKYFLVIRELYERFFNITIEIKEVLK